MENTTKRKVKLKSQSRPSKTSYTGLKNVPWLNVSGVWLEAAGFKAGDQVEIIVAKGQLTVNLIK